MAAFSRGLTSILHQRCFQLPSPIRTANLTVRRQCPPCPPRCTADRYFSSAISRRFAAPVRDTRPAIPSYVTSDPVLRRVISDRLPILLYREPNPRKYLLKVYGFAILSTGIGLYSFYFGKTVPKEQPFFVVPTYIFIGFAFVVIGVHIFQRPVRRITTLEVLPPAMGGRLQLRMRGRSHPFAKETELVTDIWEPVITEKTNPMVKEILEANRARKQSLLDGLGDRGYLSAIWELGARFLDQRWTSFFLRFKFAVLQFGQAKIDVDGVKWKLDCNGYLLEDGKALDRIISEE
ncbi:hypothetical protein DM02DRAFT_721844 [Periconia macrospinosa]|uniref:Uncharacterized protein n=1 Tax=Periconia macrospinosa TaxID=97972 RepID=A0A2V1D528_9PLEO|nr:hypothetical protein DM02DRAFT_721844 [Periconia macrospinosa]